MAHLPPVLYKYSGHNGGLAILRNCTLKISDPFTLNDPYEFYPHFIPPSREYQLKRFISQGCVSPTTLTEHFFEQWPSVEANLFSNFKEYLKEHRIACFSAVRDDLLMWAHYADMHRGLVIGFSTAGQSSDTIAKVRYRNERPKWDCERILVEERINKRAAYALILTKSIQWKYEKEYRAVYPPEIVKKFTPNPDGSIYLPISPKDIVSVHFGLRMDPKHVRDAVGLLKRPDFEHVELYGAGLDIERYAITFDRLPPITLL